MASELEAFFLAQAEHFAAGRFDLIADAHRFPLPIYRPDGITLERTREDTLRAVWSIRSTALTRGAPGAAAEVVEERVLEAGRVMARVIWRFLTPEGTELAASDARFYLRRGPEGGYLIEMIELIVQAFPGRGMAPDGSDEIPH